MARFSVSKTDKPRTAGYEIKLLKLQGHDRESVFPDSRRICRLTTFYGAWIAAL